MAAPGVPIRSLHAWMAHADINTTMIYTHYAPAPNEVELVNRGFASSHRTPGAEASRATLEPKPYGQS
jgi:hypothetical protein